jgi:hypothetical protein
MEKEKEKETETGRKTGKWLRLACKVLIYSGNVVSKCH